MNEVASYKPVRTIDRTNQLEFHYEKERSSITSNPRSLNMTNLNKLAAKQVSGMGQPRQSPPVPQTNSWVGSFRPKKGGGLS